MASLNDIREKEKENKRKNDEETKKVSDSVKKDLQEIKDDILNADSGLDQPQNALLQKIIFILTGACYFLVGFSFYYLFRGDKKKKWIADCFLIGGLIGAVIAILSGIGGFLDSIKKLFVK